MNPTVILALISDLYNQNAALVERNAELEAALAGQVQGEPFRGANYPMPEYPMTGGNDAAGD